MLRKSLLSVALGLPVLLGAFAPAAFAGDIVDTAVKAGDFKTLVTALQATGLDKTLKTKGPFTVFAPTDEAFKKLPPGTLDALLKDKAKLTKILTYHVVSGKVLSSALKPGSVKTVEGAPVKVQIEGGKVEVNEAYVTKADITADNGVIHVIDSVLLPPEGGAMKGSN
ncbi:fasciclin domain-containing protein [Gloeobacter violaceus]|uniref:Glr2150 protein n=1 Tax=Gloeobacter violaceus (strain ATCC 29082 / PCC 7421) TaxID=251221 RepID=Q7NIN3_GLOVI|nr:fasciclin domain-containing protein [Gloeobacter violaceus]BAC90091.1 glr2150 [Gloeobacter violaceus PCC 7421]